MTVRSAHRAIALTAAVVLTVSAVTGILWAYAPYLYLPDGYMRKKAPTRSPTPREAAVGVGEALRVAEGAAGRGLDVTQIVLRPDFGRLLYEVQYREGAGAPRAFLVDAIRGEPLTPLSEANAVAIARQYVRGQPATERVVLDERYTPRSGRGGPVPAYRIRFRAAGNPEIVIHRDSGRILADEDDVRRVHFVITDLHQLKLAGPVKLTAIAGLPLLALVGTGVAMWATPAWRRRRRGGNPLPDMKRAVTLLALAGTAVVAGRVDAQERPIALPEVSVEGAYERPAVPQRSTVGTKTDTPLLDVPAAIQVVPKEVFQEQGTSSVDAVTRNVSGVSHAAQSAYGFFNNFVVRGLSQQFLRDGLIDGPAINGYFRTLTDVERVEVLKGPGGALYGSGQPGGTVNLVSKLPTETPSYSLYGSGGSFGTYRFATDLGGPLGSANLGYRFNSAYYHTGGFRDVSTTIKEFLPLVQWRLTPEHTLTVKFDYRRVDAVADTVGIPFRGRTLVGVDRDTKLYTPFADTTQDVFRVALDVESRFGEDLTLRNALVLLQRDLHLLRNSANPVFLANGLTLTGRSVRDQTDHASDWLYHVEPVWKVDTGSVAHTLLGGFESQLHFLDAKRSTAALPNIANVFNPVILDNRSALVFTPNFDRHSELANYAVYAQDQIALTRQWKARLGLRWDRFDADDVDRLTPPRHHRTDDALSYSAGLVYQPVPVTSFYGGVSRGNFAIFTSEAVRGAAIAPEKGMQYEIGNKTLLLDGRFSMNTALFHTVREDFLVTVGPDQVPVGQQKTQGLEFDLAGEIVNGWKLYANYAYQDTELVSLAPADPSQGKGHSAVGVPLDAAGLWTTYEIQGGALKGLGAGFGVTYKDGVYLDTPNTLRLPAYAVLDLVGFYRTKLVDYQINVNNALDTTYYFTGRNGGGAPGDPISVFASIAVRY